MEYELKKGPLPYCRPHWNEKTQTFTDNNDMNTILCCVNNCLPYVENCFKSCDSTYGNEGKTPNYKLYNKCHTQCNDIIYSCENICLNFPSEIINYFSSCSDNYKCGTYPAFDKECLIKHPEIYDCCKKQCVSNEENDCEKECKTFYDHLSKGITSSLKNVSNNYKKEENDFKKKDNINYLLIFCVIFLFALAIGYFISSN